MRIKAFLRKYAFRIIVFAVMIGFLIYFFLRLDFKGSYEVLKNASIMFLLLALLFMLISAVVKAYRFYILLKPNNPNLRFSKFILPYLVGYGFSVLGPFKTGEVASVEINKRNLNIPRSSSFAALAFFRVVDVLVVLVFFIIALGITIPKIILNTTDPELASYIQYGTNVVFYLAIFGTIILIAILFFPPIGRFFIQIIAKILKKIHLKAGKWVERVINPALDEYYESLRFLYRRWFIATTVVLTTIIRWILEFYSLKFTIIAFGSNINLIDAASVMSIALLIGLLTFVPAGAGTGTITTEILLIGLLINKNIADASILYQALIGIILTLLLAALASPFLKEKKIASSSEENELTVQENEQESEI